MYERVRINHEAFSAALERAGVGTYRLDTMCGFPSCATKQWPTGNTKKVRLSRLQRAARVLGVPVNDLILEFPVTLHGNGDQAAAPPG
jgi:hypothetical protein